MHKETVDEFDHFCRLAKNPVSESIKYDKCFPFVPNPSDYNLYRSNSMKEYHAKKTKENVEVNELKSNINLFDKNKIVRVRSFQRTTKGVVCNKDTMEIESEKTDKRISERKSPRKQYDSHDYQIQKSADYVSTNVLRDNNVNHYVVAFLGQEGVGKTSLCQQLLMPECLVTNSDEMKQKSEAQMIRVLVDNQESILQLIDYDNGDILNDFKKSPADAYLIVYAIDDNASFETCRKLIASLILTNVNPPLVILVGNKSDLVRSRVISTEKGKRLSCIYNLKFKEISTSLNHGVDELLVLLVTEMRSFARKSEKEKPGFVPKPFQTTPYRSSLKIKVSNNAVSRFIQKHFNKSSDNVFVDN